MLTSLTILAFIFYVPVTGHADATSRFLFRILPQDCLFDIVQDGSNEIIYLTPDTCEELIDSADDIRQPDGSSPSRQPATGLADILRIGNGEIDTDEDTSLRETSPKPIETNDETSQPLQLADDGQSGDERAGTIFSTTLLRISIMLFIAALLWWLFFFYTRRKSSD